MDEKRTVDTIIEKLKELVEGKQIIPPDWWIEAAADLNVLLGDEHAKLFKLQQTVAQIKLGFLRSQDKINVSEAKLRVETTDDYRLMNEQRAKISRIEEQIRIAKIQSRIGNTEYRGF